MEIEATVNCRPLVYVGSDIMDGTVLTPGSFLSVKTDTIVPSMDDPEHATDPDYTQGETSAEILMRHWKKGMRILENFWHCWKKDYLASLRERYDTQVRAHQGRIQSKWQPHEGDVVLVHDKHLKRGSWVMGRIASLTTSHDDKVRSATVRLPNGNHIGRPISKLYPLEQSDYKDKRTSNEGVHLLSDKVGPPQSVPTKNGRDRRATAIKAQERIRACFEDPDDDD
jgi:hypothetical protein